MAGLFFACNLVCLLGVQPTLKDLVKGTVRADVVFRRMWGARYYMWRAQLDEISCIS